MRGLLENPVTLTGLPGAGKQRVRQALQTQFDFAGDQIETDSAGKERSGVHQPVWCVIDIRSPFDEGRDRAAVEHLAFLVRQASGVVFTFSEAADLDSQTFWSQWLRQQQPQVPVVRLVNGRFPQAWQGFKEVDLPGEKGLSPVLKASSLQTFEFEVGPVYLDHLMMGLDNSRQNLGMQIWRVAAVLDTFEYENRVALEATPFRWDSYAADTGQVAGRIRVQGLELDEKWLKEVIEAALLRP